MKQIRRTINLRNLIVGVDAKVPLYDGRLVTSINFDNAATTPPFFSVLREIYNFSHWYSSIHRGAGYKSQISSKLYEKSREIVAKFVNADLKSKAVIFVKNTTEAVNKLSYRLLEKHRNIVVLSTEMEHHSNDLPWRNKYTVDYTAVDQYGRLSMEDLETKLIKYNGQVKLVTITGASNVTGYINPIHKAAALAHRYNAKILVDGAQLIPHVPFDMKPIDSPEHIDYLVFSGHKMYAPFGTGVLIGPKETFEAGDPEYSGGGTVDIVTRDFVQWTDPPHKEEAGTPNIMGVVALTAAMKTLNMLGMRNIDQYEKDLAKYTIKKFQQIPDIQLYIDPKDDAERVAIIPFNIDGIPHDITALLLSYEGGIAVRNGCFCAQPYIQKLLGIPPKEMGKYKKNPSLPRPGVVRISYGFYNTYWEIDILVELLKKIVKNKAWYLTKYNNFNFSKI